MKKLLFIIILLIPNIVFAQRGCCSHHGGVAGCNSNGRQVYRDGSLSPSCKCTPPVVYGCTDPKADNYNPNANKNNNSCKYAILGCTNKKAKNYNSKATKDDGSCIIEVKGCTDYKATNYNSNANTDDGSCVYNQETKSNIKTNYRNSVYQTLSGCTDKNASNYNSRAIIDNGSCIYKENNEGTNTFMLIISIITLIAVGIIIYKNETHKQ